MHQAVTNLWKNMPKAIVQVDIGSLKAVFSRSQDDRSYRRAFEGKAFYRSPVSYPRSLVLWLPVPAGSRGRSVPDAISPSQEVIPRRKAGTEGNALPISKRNCDSERYGTRHETPRLISDVLSATRADICVRGHIASLSYRANHRGLLLTH